MYLSKKYKIVTEKFKVRFLEGAAEFLDNLNDKERE